MNTPESIIERIDIIGREEVIKSLHNLYFISDDKKTRIKTLEILNRLQDDTHFEEIENYFLSDEEPEVRIEAAKLLAFNYDGRTALEPLIWVLKNEKKINLRREALMLLVPLAQKYQFRDYIISVLRDALKNDEKKIQMDAAESLGMLKEESVIDELINLLNSGNKNVRIKVIQALGALKSQKAVPDLINNLKLKSLDEWKFTYNALIKLISRKLLNELLLQKLNSMGNRESNYEISLFKQGLIRALGESGFDDSIPHLIPILKVHYDWLREETLHALEKIDSNWKRKFREELKKKNINL